MISSDLKDLFNNIMSDSPLDENSTITSSQIQSKLCNGIVDVMCDALNASQIIPTVYSGACPLGSVAATVFGTNPTLNSTLGKSAAVGILMAQVPIVTSDAAWTSAICNAAVTLLSACTINDSLISGVAIPPVVPPPTVPVVGSAMGVITCIAPLPPIQAALNAVAATLKATALPNSIDIYSTALGTALTAILGANTCSVNGIGTTQGLVAISGLVGII